MKKSVWIGIFCFAAAGAATFYISYKTTYDELRQMHAADETETEIVLAAAAPQETITTTDTVYVLQSCDRQTGEVEEETGTLPVAYLACTRTELTALLQEYEEEPSLDDLENGFVSISLQSFSADRIVVRKTYDSTQAGRKYCVLADDGLLTVYYADKETIYEYTTIPVDTLPTGVQQEVSQGKYFSSLTQLFSFLETYSS